MESLTEKFNNADSLYHKGNFEKALDIYLYLYNEDFRTMEVLEKIVWIYFNNYDFDNAEKYIEIYLSKDPENLDILSAKVSILFKNQQFDEALIISNKMIDINPNSQMGYSFKLSLLSILHRDSEREELIKILKTENEDLYNNINFFENINQSTFQNNSSFNDFYYNVEKQKTNKSENPIEDFFDEMTWEITKTNDDLALYNFLISDKNDKNDEFNALVSKAKDFADEGKYNNALEYINWALEFYPNNIETLIFKTSILIDLEEYNQGLSTIDLVLQLNKRNIKGILIKGLIYIKLEEYSLAQKLFKTTLNKVEDNILIWRHYYMSFAIEGNIENGLEICKKAISKFPQDKDLYRDKHYFEKILKNNKSYKNSKDNLESNSHNIKDSANLQNNDNKENSLTESGDSQEDLTISDVKIKNTKKRAKRNKNKNYKKEDLDKSQFSLDDFF